MYQESFMKGGRYDDRRDYPPSPYDQQPAPRGFTQLPRMERERGRDRDFEKSNGRFEGGAWQLRAPDRRAEEVEIFEYEDRSYPRPRDRSHSPPRQMPIRSQPPGMGAAPPYPDPYGMMNGGPEPPRERRPPRRGEWVVENTACCDDVTTTCRVCFLSPCIAADIAGRMGEGWYVPLCLQGGLMAMRTKLRQQREIQGTICSDCAMTTFCGWCTIYQMEQEMDEMERDKRDAYPFTGEPDPYRMQRY